LRLEQPLEPARAVATVPVSSRPASARPATPAPAAPDRVEPTPHVVQSGENFWTISRLYYGSGRFYKALWKANADRVPRPEDLRVGDTIRVPPPEQLDPKLVDSPPAQQPSSRTPPRDAEAKRVAQAAGSLVMLPLGRPSRPSNLEDDPEPQPPTATHVVRPRETLRSIARDRLGDARREGEILDLNLDQLGEDPTLRPGMRLRLPADANEPTGAR
jgi:nucleoid-associated protein YgaU